jgi:prepilin-type N-terminal cleavage/methylation domain-containing protein
MKQHNGSTRGFTLVELMAVVVILAIMAGVALPRFFDYKAQAQLSACKGTLGAVRAGIANFYANAAIGGSAAYPTTAQLTTVGTVMQEVLPENPYNNKNAVFDATTGNAANRDTDLGGANTNGWAYYAGTVAGKPAVFWANTNDVGENTF